jgi:hypothetical protein
MRLPQREHKPRFTPLPPRPTLTFVKRCFVRPRCPQFWAALWLLCVCIPQPSSAQESPAAEPSEIPAQIELLETHIRFEANGDSRKEVHTVVHINNGLGVGQFSRLAFDFNRSFQQIEIPLVHITHASGGTADILPSAITDQPNPAVAHAPGYQDVRVKSIRILGLAPGDNLEYRIVTTTTHHPLAPDFWLDHSFDPTGIVSREVFEIDIPASRHVEIRTNPRIPPTSTEKAGGADSSRNLYRWQRSATTDGSDSQGPGKPPQSAEPDVALSTFSWERLSIQLDEKLTPGAKPLEQMNSYEESLGELSRQRGVTPQLTAKALELAKAARTKMQKFEALYDFVSQKVATIDLPVGSSGFAPRPPAEILSSGYATPEDKFVLFAALSSALDLRARALLTGYCNPQGIARPSAFTHLLISAGDGQTNLWLDPSLEVAPFGVVSAPGKCAFVLAREFFLRNSTGHEWQPISPRFPFASFQRVNVDAALAQDGTLNAKVRYTMRGENELLLRVAFHQSPREKWKDVAQLLALSDGFRGKIISSTASDPYATKQPFTIEYEITQPKFVDWSKKLVRVPALLPQLGLPDPPGKSAAEAGPSAIELGTPLNVDTRLTLHLPAGTTVEGPTGTSVERDYATFTSHYATEGNVVFASRHINFILREVPAERAADYQAFLHAVQTDQAQLFTLSTTSTPAKTATSKP